MHERNARASCVSVKMNDILKQHQLPRYQVPAATRAQSSAGMVQSVADHVRASVEAAATTQAAAGRIATTLRPRGC